MFVKDTKFQKSKDTDATDLSDEDKTPIQTENEGSDEIDSDTENEIDHILSEEFIIFSKSIRNIRKNCKKSYSGNFIHQKNRRYCKY